MKHETVSHENELSKIILSLSNLLKAQLRESFMANFPFGFHPSRRAINIFLSREQLLTCCRGIKNEIVVRMIY